MKIVLCITAACAIAAPALSQSGQPGSTSPFLQHTVATNSLSLLDSIINYDNWNSTSNAWNSAFKSVYAYDAYYKEESEFMYNRLGNTWQNVLRATNYTSDTNHNLLEKIYYSNVSGIWTESGKETYTYDGSNHMLTRLYQNYSGGLWINVTNTIYTYSGNNLASSTFQSWNTNAAAWDNLSRVSYTYNTNDRIISRVEETWTSGTWVNDHRNINYVYTGTELTAYETETWNTATAAYEPDTKTSCTYNGNHDLLNTLTVKWNTTMASWDNNVKEDFTYAANGTLSGFLGQAWDNVSATWKNMIKIQYYYRTGYVGVNESSTENSAFVMHPNPTSDCIKVSTSGNHRPSTVFIKDLSGKTVMTRETNQADHFSIDVRTLEAGLYFIELKNEQGSANQKFIKQ